jgi:hypothetical protein
LINAAIFQDGHRTVRPAIEDDGLPNDGAGDNFTADDLVTPSRHVPRIFQEYRFIPPGLLGPRLFARHIRKSSRMAIIGCQLQAVSDMRLIIAYVFAGLHLRLHFLLRPLSFANQFRA